MSWLLVALPHVLTVAGGLAGIAYVNTTAHGSPLFGIVLGALAGRLLAAALVRVLDRAPAPRAPVSDKTPRP